MDIRGIQKITLIDYPGKVATTVFTMGCDFRCSYCHNPELVEKIDSTPEKMGVVDVLKFLEIRKKFIDAVVITGGEPTMQKNIISFIEKIKELDLLVKLDTNGSRPEVLEKLLEKKIVDYVAMDIKAPFEKYQEIAGKSDTKKIKQSIEIVKKFPDYEFRTTVSKHLSAGDITKIAETIAESGIAKKYFLQQMRFIKILKPDYTQELYTKEELEVICRMLKPFIYNVGVRNV
ncbi:MAG: anaerobic ribonucleoside-triphosphate reductase activating protein [Candidatus Aenigmatarchaeota archaeon]